MLFSFNVYNGNSSFVGNGKNMIKDAERQSDENSVY